MIVKFFKFRMLKKEEKQASEECFRPQQAAAAREKRADESLGIENDNTFARKDFFLRYISLENKQAKLK